MKIFLIWTGAEGAPGTIGAVDSLLKLKEDGKNQIVYWMGGSFEGGKKMKEKSKETIFHYILNAVQGIPAENVNPSEFPPPGKDLIDQMHRAESIILTMMNRSKTSKLSTDQRKHLYYNLLQYWYGVFKKYKPDIIINQTIPHDICSYLIYELAHLLKIKTVMFEITGICNRLLTHTDFWKGSDELLKEIQKNQGKNFSLEELNGDLKKYYEMQMDPICDATPLDIKVQKKQHSLKESIKNHTFLKTIKHHIASAFRRNLKKEYKSVQIEPDFNKNFIYVPLQTQPECTTSPQGDIFVDQILMIEILSAALPLGWIIYVKEHPIQWLRRGLNFSHYRYQGYYKKIAGLKNVQIVPLETDTYDLINKSRAVAAITGTVGWEAILRGKSAMIFGYPWYRDCPELFRVEDVESCRKALEKIINGHTINQQQIINYLKCLDNVTIRGYFSELEKNSELTMEESRENIIQKILLKMHENR